MVKKETSWEDIGKSIGAKMESAYKKGECKSWGKSFVYKHENKGGFFGRFLFIMGIWAALSLAGYWTFPWWVSLMIIMGFSFMKF